MHIVKAKSLYLSLSVSIIQPFSRGVVPIGRTAVSKTDGWGFESLHPCHFIGKNVPFLGDDITSKRVRV